MSIEPGNGNSKSVDLTPIFKNSRISIETDEHEHDRAHRLWEKRLWTRTKVGAVVICGLALMGLGLLAIAVGFGAISPTTPEEARKYAATVGSAIISGAIGWVGGSLR